MRALLFCLMTCCIAATANSQYYYKDQLLTSQTIRQLQHYRAQKIHSIKLNSFENDNTPTRDFTCEVSIDPGYLKTITHTKSALADESQLTALYNTQGQLVQTVDTTDGSGSVTDYEYDRNNRIIAIRNASSSAGQETEHEVHLWRYNATGKPLGMLRMRGSDTTYITFTLDEKGNVAEEKSTRKGIALPTVYYYYDDENRLTDIVRYNLKAKRLLPDYMFEYDSSNRVNSMVVVPEGSSDYQKWHYTYNDKGLKEKETCYNKRQALLGRIEYKYGF